MKFAIVCPNNLSIPGGVQEICLEMHRRLILLGHQSVLISTKPRTPITIPNSKFFGSSIQIPMNKSVTTVSEGDISGNGEVRKFLSKEHFDVICIHEPAQPFLNWEILKFVGPKKIGWFHGTLPSPIRFRYILLSYVVRQRVIEGLNAAIAISPVAKKTWLNLAGDKSLKFPFTIIPAGIDIEKFRAAKKIDLGKLPKILFVGRLEERKGLLHAIKAISLVLKTKKVRFFIVGDGPEKENASELVKMLGIQKNVVFVGRVSPDKLPSYYKSCDLFIAPSLGAESFGIVLLEAMAAEIPIVTYANPGYKTTLSGYPWREGLVKVGAYKKLAKSIITLSKNKELIEKIKTWERKKVRDYDWNKIIKDFIRYTKQIT